MAPDVEPLRGEGGSSCVTYSASGVGETSATLEGDLQSFSAGYHFWFYGPSGDLEANTTGPISNTSLGAVSAFVSGLSPGTTYECELSIVDNNGQTYGGITTFTTAEPPSYPPSATTEPAILISANGATLVGEIFPNSNSTTYDFQWGLTDAYGNTTGVESAGSGGSEVPVTTVIGGLLADTTYHYRAVAANGYGSAYGADMTFTTTSVPIVMLV